MDEPTETAQQALPKRHSLWTIAWILYGTLALLFIAMPVQVANRLDDLPSTPAVRGVQGVALAVAKASDAVGIETSYDWLRKRFLAAAGIGGN